MSKYEFKYEKIGKGIIDGTKYLVYAINKYTGKVDTHAPIGMVDRGSMANDWHFRPIECSLSAEDVGLNEEDFSDPLGCIGYPMWEHTREGAVLGYLAKQAKLRKMNREKPADKFFNELIRIEVQVERKIRQLAGNERIEFDGRALIVDSSYDAIAFDGQRETLVGPDSEKIGLLNELSTKDLIRVLQKVKESVNAKKERYEA